MMGRRFQSVLLGLAGVILLAGTARSTEIIGTNFNVVYDPTTLGLFGSLSLIGNTLAFTPNNFIAVSTNGQGTVTPTGGATTASGIELIAHPGFQFGSLQLTEFGDYLLQGSGTSVSVSGELIAFDGDSTADPVSTYTTSTITPGGPLTVTTGTAQNWKAQASITNATPTLGGGGPWLSGAGTVDVSLENLLSATTSSPNSEALVQKKAAFGGVGLLVTPLPPPVWLLGSAIVAFGVAARGRKWVLMARGRIGVV
jgi:hypothetical protein